jgi:rhodanese-related sulfurtransferase
MNLNDYMPYFIGIVFGSLIGGTAAYFLVQMSSDNPIKQYYDIETAVSVSPFDYVREMESGNSSEVLVDLRNSNDYEVSHFNGSINIPAEEMSAEYLVSSFGNLSKDKTPVVFCYASYCMLGRKTGKLLADNGIYVKHLNIGWAELKRDFSKYIVNGTAVTPFGGNGSASCTGAGSLAC